jgi:phenylalanine-4-hydroxylase
MSREELDDLGTKSLEYGEELDSDHPGFHDTEYRDRRRTIVQNGRKWRYRDGEQLPLVEYSAAENATWALIYDHLKEASRRHAVHSFNEILSDMEEECDYDKGRVPQLESVSRFLS